MLHTLAPIIESAPSGPGALAGFETVCYDCGLRIRSSLRTIVEADVREHIAYMAAREADAFGAEAVTARNAARITAEGWLR